MGSRKRQSKIDRLPADYETPRAPEKGHQTGPAGDSGATLSRPSMPGGQREDRNAAAVRYLLRRGAADLIEVLGLAAEPPKPTAPSGVNSVPCPQCGKPVGVACETGTGGAYGRGHRGRAGRAQELREAAA